MDLRESNNLRIKREIDNILQNDDRKHNRMEELSKCREFSNTVNSFNVEKLKILIESRIFDTPWIWKILENCDVESVNLMDNEIFELLLQRMHDHEHQRWVIIYIFQNETLNSIIQKVSINEFGLIIGNISCIRSLKRLELLLQHQRFLNTDFILAIFTYPRLLFTVITMNIKKLAVNDALPSNLILELFGKHHSVRLDKLELLLTNSKYCNYTVRQLMRSYFNYRLFDSIKFGRFKTLLYAKKLDARQIWVIFENPVMLNRVNMVTDVQKLKYIIRYHDKHMFWNILQHEQALQGVNLIDSRRLFLLYRNDLLYYQLTVPFLSNHDAIKIMNSIEMNLFKQIVGGLEVFEVVVNILVSEKSQNFKDRLLVLVSNENHRLRTLTKLFKNLNILDTMIFLDIKKLKIMKSISGSDVLKILQNKTRIDVINAIDFEKLKLLIENEKFGNIILDGLPNLTDVINSIEFDKLDFLKKDIDLIHIVRDEIILNSINLLHLEKLKLLFKYHLVFRMLENVNVVNRFHSLDVEKLKILSDWDIVILKMKSFDFVNLFNVEKLKIMTEMIDNDEFIEMSECTEKDDNNMIRNLNFVIALYKVGQIDRDDEIIDRHFLCNNTKEIYEKIIKLFPVNFPIDQMLIPSKDIEENGKIQSLKSMCIQKIICLVADCTDTEPCEQKLCIKFNMSKYSIKIYL